MRLQIYINEITDLSNEEVDDILDKGFERFKDLTKKSKFKPWPMILLYLQTAFKPLKIVFSPSGTMLDKLLKIDYKGATVLSSKDIVIPITIEELRKLKNVSYVNTYKNSIINTVTHELIHRKQPINTSLIKNKVKREEYEKRVSYYERPREIEAFAREAVRELENGDSDIVFMYNDEMQFVTKNDKVWRTFLKKLYQYVDMYGSDRCKENLRKQLAFLGEQKFIRKEYAKMYDK
jgi:hypothetical protein